MKKNNRKSGTVIDNQSTHVQDLTYDYITRSEKVKGSLRWEHFHRKMKYMNKQLLIAIVSGAAMTVILTISFSMQPQRLSDVGVKISEPISPAPRPEGSNANPASEPQKIDTAAQDGCNAFQENGQTLKERAGRLTDKDAYYLLQNNEIQSGSIILSSAESALLSSYEKKWGGNYDDFEITGLPEGVHYPRSLQSQPCKNERNYTTFLMWANENVVSGEYPITFHLKIGDLERKETVKLFVGVLDESLYNANICKRINDDSSRIEESVATKFHCAWDPSLQPKFPQSTGSRDMYLFTKSGSYVSPDTAAGAFKAKVATGTYAYENDTEEPERLVTFDTGHRCGKECYFGSVEVASSTVSIKNPREFLEFIQKDLDIGPGSSECKLTFTAKNIGGYETILISGYSLVNCDEESYLFLLADEKNYFKIINPESYLEIDSIQKIK